MNVASDAARQYLRLLLVDGLGPVLITRLVEHFGGLERVLSAGASQLQHVERVGRDVAERIRQVSGDEVEREVALAAERGVRILCIEDDAYPRALRNIADPPICLYVRGTLQPEDAVALGIVGARHCSTYGAEQAERFAALAAQAGLTIVSGMALGVDTAAHRGALLTQGRTLAVLGCGLCHLYPPRSEPLAERIAASGALLSEFPMSTPPHEHNFPRRNRIIAGLSLGVLVVEATRRSGALITARLASEYNREVFAVPGRVDHPYAEGCHWLIRSGAAKLVTHLPDILEELGDVGQKLMPRAEQPGDSREGDEQPSPSDAPAAPSLALEPHERQLLNVLSVDPLSIEALTAASGLSPARVAATLVALQLKGLVKRHAGDVYSRAGHA